MTRGEPAAASERLDLDSDRARRLADQLANVFAEVELAIERRRQAARADAA